MTLIDLFGLSLAFLAPVPFERPRLPEPLPGNAWIASVIIVSVVVSMVLPMVMIWGFHRPEEAFRTRCEAMGRRAVFSSLDGSGPRHCRRPEQAAER